MEAARARRRRPPPSVPVCLTLPSQRSELLGLRCVAGEYQHGRILWACGGAGVVRWLVCFVETPFGAFRLACAFCARGVPKARGPVGARRPWGPYPGRTGRQRELRTPCSPFPGGRTGYGRTSLRETDGSRRRWGKVARPRVPTVSTGQSQSRSAAKADRADRRWMGLPAFLGLLWSRTDWAQRTAHQAQGTVRVGRPAFAKRRVRITRMEDGCAGRAPHCALFTKQNGKRGEMCGWKAEERGQSETGQLRMIVWCRESPLACWYGKS